MKKSYTLNEFYRTAQKLIEKHNGVEAGHELAVSFTITEDKGRQVLNCSVSYAKDYEYKYFASSITPESAMIWFEKDILRIKGESYIDDVSVEFTDTSNSILIPSKL